MQTRKLTDAVSVSPQITPEDVEAIKSAGFMSIICNRPNGEAADQPAFAEIERRAEELGLRTAYVPVHNGQLGDEQVTAFHAAVETLPKPILAYCRSGTRSAMLWALDEAGSRPIEEIVSIASAAGYDLSNLVPRLVQASQSIAERSDA